MDYFERAKSQGVERPFLILSRMDAPMREEIARTLGIRLRSKGNAQAQAWEIINRDVMGLQARTHHLLEKLSPFSRNNNWWEIVTRAASWMRVPYYPGLSEKQIERLFFECIAQRIVSELSATELEEIDLRAQQNPELSNALAATGLSANAVRLVFFGLGGGPTLPKPMFLSMSRGLSVLLQNSRQIFTRWAQLPTAYRSFNRSQWKLAATLSALYLQNFVEESLEEFQSLRF